MKPNRFFLKFFTLIISSMVLSGCITSRVEDACIGETGIKEGEAVVVMAKSYHLGNETEEKYIRCVEDALALLRLPGRPKPLQLGNQRLLRFGHRPLGRPDRRHGEEQRGGGCDEQHQGGDAGDLDRADLVETRLSAEPAGVHHLTSSRFPASR